MLTVALLVALAPVELPLEATLETIEVTVVVPLCDGAVLACGRGAAGDPRSLEGNLYWGAMYGAERFLGKARGFRVVTKTDAPDPKRVALLRTVVIERAPGKGERPVRLTLHAWDGARIDDALAFFLEQARVPSSDLLVWAGHDRLMDVAAPTAPASAAPGTSANVAVLACESAQYFGPVLAGLNARPVALTRTFMAPEAYLLVALADSVARHGPADRAHLRTALVAAYAKYQRISTKAAGTVFSQLADR